MPVSLFAQKGQPAVNLDQIRNGSAASRVTPGAWVNGNLNASQAHYAEGYSVPYRLVMTSMPTNNTVVELVLGFDIKHSNRHALDYLTGFNRLEPHQQFGHPAEEIDPTIGTPFTTLKNSPTSKYRVPEPNGNNSPVPGEPVASYTKLLAAAPAQLDMWMWGGEITNIVYDNSVGDLTASQSEARVKITFKSANSTVLLAWGGHIASRLDWGFDAAGIPRSAGGISGSPYHMRTVSWTLNSLGNQDRALAAQAVIPPPACPTVESRTQCYGSNTFTFTIPNPEVGATYTWSIAGGGLNASFQNGNTGNTVTVVANPGADIASDNGGTFTLNISAVKNGLTTICNGVATGTLVDVDANAGADFTKTCVSNTSGGSIGEAAQTGYTYFWTSSPAGFTSTDANPTVNPTITTTYTVTKTHTASGCTAQDAVTVTVNDAPVTAVAGEDITKTCLTNTSGGTIGEAAAQGFSYSWTSLPAGFTSSDANPSVNPTVTTTYTVIKTNTATGCFDDDEVTVFVNNAAVRVNPGTPFEKTCVANTNGGAIGETAEAGHTYSWTSNPAGFTSTEANPTVNPTVTTIYSVTKTNTASGCYVTESVTVTVNTTAPSFTVCLVQPSLCVGSGTGSVTFTASGGSNLQYSIDGGANFQSSNVFSNLAGGSVSGFKVKNSYGCITDLACDNTLVNNCTPPPFTGATAAKVTNMNIVLNEPETKVAATPNPFNDQIRFHLESQVSGQGSLEVFNMMGQKVKTVYQGRIEKGQVITVDYFVPASQRTNLIYQFRVGDQRTTGKLIGLK